MTSVIRFFLIKRKAGCKWVYQETKFIIISYEHMATDTVEKRFQRHG